MASIRDSRVSRSLKSIAAITANCSGFTDVYAFIQRKLTKSQVAIIMYHRVCPEVDYWSDLELSTQAFETHIDYFRHKFEVIPLSEIARCIHQERSLPEKAVAITFDDGYKDNYLHAYPILKKYQVPATIFLTSGHIGENSLFWQNKITYAIRHTSVSCLKLDELGSFHFQSHRDKHHASRKVIKHLKNLHGETKPTFVEKLIDLCQIHIPDDLGKDLFLSWKEVNEMSNDSIDFGAHTVNHPILTNISLEQAKDEITQSKKEIEERLGKVISAFSYPNGNFNLELARFVKESGFTCAVSAPPCTPEKLIGAKDSPYELGRICACDFNTLKIACSGLLAHSQR